MDFIERLFGIAPDGGNGLTEAVILAAAALVAAQLTRVFVTPSSAKRAGATGTRS